jgi:hypothetical protein
MPGGESNEPVSRQVIADSMRHRRTQRDGTGSGRQRTSGRKDDRKRKSAERCRWQFRGPRRQIGRGFLYCLKRQGRRRRLCRRLGMRSGAELQSGRTGLNEWCRPDHLERQVTQAGRMTAGQVHCGTCRGLLGASVKGPLRRPAAALDSRFVERHGLRPVRHHGDRELRQGVTI